MKRIGMIAGLSWQSSVEYYRLINEGVARRLGGLNSADIAMRSLNLADIEPLMSQGDWAGVAGHVVDAGLELQEIGAECLMLCTNTVHKVVPELEAELYVPLLHIADATAEAIKSAGYSRVGLLGTRFTMEQDFYSGILADKHGLTVYTPDSRGRRIVDSTIFDELCTGQINESSRSRCLEVIDHLVEQGSQGIVLGCTELPLLIRESDTDVPIFDTLRIHAEYAVNYALKED